MNDTIEYELRCDRMIYSNSSFLNGSFNGIPENMLINFIISVVLLIIFLILKFCAWKYQNVLFNIYRDNWCSLLYRDVFDLIPETGLINLNSKYNPLNKNMSYLAMIWFCFVGITNKEMVDRSGDDSFQYLQFLKHTIQYSVVDTVLVIVCVLPINFQGSVHQHDGYFSRTTAGNIDFQRHSKLLWMHICIGFILMIAGFFFIRRFSYQLIAYRCSRWSEKTMVLREKGPTPLTVQRIQNFFEIAMKDTDNSDIFPAAMMQDIKLVFKYKRLIQLRDKLNTLEEVLAICQHIENVESRQVTVKEPCWCCSFNSKMSQKKMDGLTYYKKERDNMKGRVAKELNRLPTKSLPIAFVTFRNQFTAVQIRDLQEQSRNIESYKNLQVKISPDPRNIIWENLRRKQSNFTFKTLFINTAVFLIAVFLTTPAVILSSTDIMKTSQMQTYEALKFIPTLIVWILARAIAVLVTYSSSFLDFETRSKMNRSIMLKTVSFLIFTVVILPSLGLTSIKAFITWTLTEGQFEESWRCIFLPDNGAFFVNYVMTSACVGNVVQLLRLPELFMCALSVMMSRSEAEKMIIRKTYMWDFSYGVQYAHSLLMFTLVQFFSLMCPVISPFGLFYFMIKFAVDRYNICFASSPSHHSFKMHSLTLKFMMFALCMKNIGLFFLIYIRGGGLPVLYASKFLAVLTILFCIFTLNPCRGKFLPRMLLMPHQMYGTSYFDFLEEGLPERIPEEKEDKEDKLRIYQPSSLRGYLCLLSPLDRFGNPIPVMRSEIEKSDSVEDVEEIGESF